MMSKLDQLPDQNQIEQIRKRLWSGQEFGQAAVMVGAGFSRNAERISSSVLPFPLWHQLAERMYEALYPAAKDERAKVRATSGAGALKLASEFEELFGRQALDEMLLEAIPDNNYQPGPLHHLMLSLPWSDVFTTNYDTLLERTRSTIYERKYDVILSPSDIPGRMKPRIVKLHGSVPSDRPFILTEEDYRTYPTRFAPLVNMVQQSIMENAFCLIGFSGDDPNFFYWTGWVRDHLGPATPPIYLCGLLDLSTPQRRLLESRGIRPIDFSPLFPEAELPDPQMRHSKAIEWFLLNLLEGAPPNVMTWPVARSGASRQGSDLPAIPPGPRPLAGPGKRQPERGSWENPDLKELQEIQKAWRRNREEYPGWVLAPYRNREELWGHTACWIEPVIQGAGRLGKPDDLFLLYELAWRLEATLSSLYVSWANEIENILLRYCPYPVAADALEAVYLEHHEQPRSRQEEALRPDKDKELLWGEIRRCWVDLAFVLLRHAREDLQIVRFSLWLDVLGEIARERKEWQARLHHEVCLFHLFCFDWEELHKALAAWPEMLDVPFNETKRAAIMAEVGNLNEALRVAEVALAGIRSRFRPYFTDYALLSQEGWTLALIELIKEGVNPRGSFRSPQGDRWEKLQLYGCNPWPEIEHMQLLLKGSAPHLWEQADQDLAVLSAQGNPHYIADLRPAFGYLRLFEEGALPIYSGTESRFAPSVLDAVRRVENLAPFWALSCMIRTSLEEEILDWFHTARIDSWMTAQVDMFFELFKRALEDTINDLLANLESALEEGSFTARQIRILPELLSRLCVRCNTEQHKELLNLAVQVYNLQIFQRDDSLHACIQSLFSNLLSLAMAPSEIVEHLSILLDLPIPTESGFHVPAPKDWAEPFAYIQWPKGARLGDTFDRSTWTARIASLLSILRHGKPEARKRAILRLAKLHEIGGLSSDQEDAFGGDLWSRTDPESGLPLYLPFPLTRLPDLPGPKEVIQRTIGSYVKGLLDPVRATAPDEFMDGVLALALDSSRGNRKRRSAVWTSDVDLMVICKIESWWQSASSNGSSNEAEKVIKALVSIIRPSLADPGGEVRRRAMELFVALDAVLPSRFLVTTTTLRLFLGVVSSDEVTENLYMGLKSRDVLLVEEALGALSLWIEHGTGSVQPPPAFLLNELIRKLLTCRPPLLQRVMEHLSSLMKSQPQIFGQHQVDRLLEALEYFVEETCLAHIQAEGGPGALALIPERERPRCRELAASIAYQLFRHHKRARSEMPPILLLWKRICDHDNLPQVRNAWPAPVRTRLVAPGR